MVSFLSGSVPDDELDGVPVLDLYDFLEASSIHSDRLVLTESAVIESVSNGRLTNSG